MRSEVRRASCGEGAFVIVRGDAGVGKSALVRWVLNGSDAEAVFVGHCRFLAEPLAPIAEVALSILTSGMADVSHPDIAMFRRPLAMLLPGIVDGPDLAEEPRSDRGEHWTAGATSVVLSEAVLRLVRSARTSSPRVLLFEDVHWADSPTVAVLERLADCVTETSVSLVVTLRPGESAVVDRWVEDVQHKGRVTVVDLRPLDAGDAARLVDRCLGAAAPLELVEAVCRVSDGVPLLVEEFVRDALALGGLQRVGDVWTVTGPLDESVPASLARSVTARLAAMDGTSRRVVQTAALLGREIDDLVLATATGATDPEVDRAVRAAISNRLVDRDGGRLRFHHALTSEAIVDDLSRDSKRSLATAMMERFDAARARGLRGVAPAARTTAMIAEAAEAWTAAASVLLADAASRLDRGALHGVVEDLRRASALATQGGAGELSLKIDVALARAEASAGDIDIDVALRNGVALLGQLPDHDPSAILLRLALARGALSASRLRDAAELTAPLGSDADSLRASIALAQGDLDQAETLARSAVTIARGADGGALLAEACEAALVLGRLARRHDLAAAERWFRSAVGDAARAGLVLREAEARHELATITQLERLSVAELHTAREAALSAGSISLVSSVDFHLAAVHGVRFEPAPALEIARRCLTGWRRIGSPVQEAFAWILIGQAHAVSGHRARAAAAGDEAVGLAGDNPEIAGLATGTCRGLASLLADDCEAARREFSEGVAHLRAAPDRVPLPPWYLWPLIIASDPIDDGRESAAALMECDVESLRVAAGPDALWRLGAAVQAGRTGDLESAEATAAGALIRLDRLGEPFAGYRHLACWLAAPRALTDGWGQPIEWLSAARQWFSAHGLDATARGCDRLLTRAGIPRRRRRAGTEHVPANLARLGITGRELDVLHLVAEGLANRAIAERLHVSVRTVKTHVEHLLAKTGTNNRTQLARHLPTPTDA